MVDIISATFSDAFFQDGYMWVFDNYIQAVCKINLDNFNMEVVSSYRNKERFEARKIYCFQNKFYFVKVDSQKILVYNRDGQNGAPTFYTLDSLFDSEESQVVYQYENMIYFFPHSLDGKIVSFDMENQKYCEKSSIASLLHEKFKNDSPITSCSYGSSVWFALYGTNCYGKYSTTEETVELFQIEDTSVCLDRICFDGRHLWYTKIDDSEIVCLGEKVIKVPGEQFFLKICDTKEWIVVLPKYGDKIVLLQKGSVQMFIVNLPLSEHEREQKRMIGNLAKCCDYDGQIFFLPHGITDLFVLDIKKWTVKRQKLMCDHYAEKLYMENQGTFYEGRNMELKTLLRVCDNKSAYFGRNEKNKNIGDSIWKRMRLED